MLSEQIKTIKYFRQTSIKEKGSEFIAIVYPVDNEETAVNQLTKSEKNIMMHLIIVTPIKSKPVN